MHTSPKGFTLIELVVVIVILGILAVTAVPRFLDYKSDARKSAIEGLHASIVDAAILAHSKAIIAGVENNPRTTAPDDNQNEGTPSVETNLGYLELKYGYPEAHAEEGVGIIEMVNLGNSIDDEGKTDWDICFSSNLSRCSDNNSSNVRIGIGIDQEPGLKCYVKYIEPTGTDNPYGEDSYYVEKQTSEC